MLERKKFSKEQRTQNRSGNTKTVLKDIAVSVLPPILPREANNRQRDHNIPREVTTSRILAWKAVAFKVYSCLLNIWFSVTEQSRFAMKSISTTDVCNTKKRKRRKILKDDIAVDYDDFTVICHILSRVVWSLDTSIKSGARKMIVSEIISLPNSIGELRSLTDLDLFRSEITSLPHSIGDLARLKTLTLCTSSIREIPPSIGRLRNLKDLNLSVTKNLLRLPEEIGELKSLTKLDLYSSKIKSVPLSVGKLKNLKELILSGTENLSKLPDEIGKLSGLIKLYLNASNIALLPPSIGQLKSLKDLYLRETEFLFELPDEMGDMTALNRLDLSYSKIGSLPRSIGRLQNLKELYLICTCSLSKLPHEIGDLASLNRLILNGSTIEVLPSSVGQLQNLKHLNLSLTKITSLPDSIGSLSGLMYLNSHGTHIPELQGIDYLLTLSQDCQSLGSLDAELERGRFKLGYELACNRARSRTIQAPPTLWPLMLENATHAFKRYEGHRFFGTEVFTIQKPEAIYQLLVLRRESFIKVLVDRNAKENTTGMKNVT
jgi:Leucine-rich repeat (LRR) protein